MTRTETTETTGTTGTSLVTQLPRVVGWTLEEARWERWSFHAGDHLTPWERGWRRDVYERVVCPFWAALTAGLRPVRPDGRFPGREVLARLPRAVADLARAIPADEQECFLAALNLPFEESIGPVDPDCRCRYCAAARRDKAAEPPREAVLRAWFASRLAWHLELVLKAPNRYDRARGAPRVLWRGGARSAQTGDVLAPRAAGAAARRR